MIQKDRKVNGGVVLWGFDSFNPHRKRAIHLLQELDKVDSARYTV